MSNRLQALKDRIRAVRLHQNTISDRSGLDESTVGRTLAGKTVPLSSTLDAIEAVVAAEEAEMLKHLVSITPGSAA